MEFRKGTVENLGIKPAFWKNKRVLITGHTGFKGSWLCLWLLHLGADVIGFALDPPTQPNLFRDAGIAQDIISIKGDVRNLKQVEDAIKSHRPEIVLHLAAQSLVRYSYKAPLETYSTNIIGTGVVLEAIRRTDTVKAVLIVTSDKCYDNKEWVWGYRESDPMGGYDPYSSSKGCAELITTAYRNSYFSAETYAEHGVAVASARAGNVIGGGDWAEDRLMPDIYKSILVDVPLIIRNPDAIRPWQFVLEPLAGYLMLAESLWQYGREFSGGWNFGPDYSDCRPVSWIVDQISRYWPNRFTWSVDTAKQPHEAHFLMLDCSKAKRLLGWRPRLTLSTALEWVNDWYMEYSGNNKYVRQTVESQIVRYMEIL